MKYHKYYPNLPYHNKDHANIVENRALAIAEKMQQTTDVELNLDIISEAAKLHDAWFGDEGMDLDKYYYIGFQKKHPKNSDFEIFY